MKQFFYVLMLLILISSAASAGIIGNMNFTKTYKNPAGPVTFYHSRHAERFIDDCGFCHSALETFGGSVNELFAHKVCQKCHESHNGPTDCSQCHQGYTVTRK